MNKHYIFLRFFVFNLTLSVFFIFSQKLFENNFFIAYPFLWITLMTAIPLGAAVYSRHADKLDRVITCLFPAGFLYLTAVMTAFMNVYVFTWDTGVSMPINNLLRQNFIQFLWEIAISGPLWVIIGIMEMNLYKALSKTEEKTQWLSYLSGVTGLLSGMVIVFYLLPEPGPSSLALLALLFFLVYSTIPPLRLTKWAALLILLLAPFLITNSYTQSPQKTYQKFSSLLRLSGTDSLTTRLDVWRRSVHLTVGQRSSYDELCGFYNNVFHWNAKNSSNKLVDTAVGSLMAPRSVIAVLGSGGGAQMPPLLASKPDKIYAVDIIPGLFEDLSGLGVDVFQNPLTETVVRDARKFIAQSTREFDLIFLPATETPMQLSKSLFEPYNALFTLEAFATYRKKLKPGGLVIITKPVIIFELSCLNNYISTLKAAGFKTGFYADRSFALIIAAIEEKTLARTAAALKNYDRSLNLEVDGSEKGIVIIDDKPFYASGILYNQATQMTFVLFLAFGIILLAAIVFVILKYFARGATVLPPILCGINYTLLLLTFQLLLFFQMPNPLEAAIIGNVIFIAMALLGGAVYKNKTTLAILVAACFLSPLILKVDYPSAILGGAVMISGGFFPRLLYYFRERLAFLLILDGLGAAIAGGIYLVVPTLLGIRLLFCLSLVIFTVTMISVGSIYARAKTSQ